MFGPAEANIGDFFAAASSLPLTDTTYDEAARILTLTFRDTALTSGEPVTYEDSTKRTRHEQYVHAYSLPTSFSAGTLKGSNTFMEKAEVRQAGDDTQLILTLTEPAQQYTAETGQLLKNESRPYLRVLFRDTWDW